MDLYTPTFKEALRYWIYLGFVNFGGPAGQISIMHRDIVEKRKWITEDRFMHALNYCMLLPGPEAQQLAIYIGWMLHRIPGGIAAGIFFIVPGFLIILGLSFLYVIYGDVAWVSGIFIGLRPVVTAIILYALFRIARKALKTTPLYLVAVFAFAGIFLFGIPFPIVILAAAVFGFVGGIYFPVAMTGRITDPVNLNETRNIAPRLRAMLRSTVKTVLVAGVLWLAPVAILFAYLGWENVFTKLAVFFSTAAVVTFGGAYAVLAFMAQAAVEWYGWMQPGQMLDGLAMAESTPGPLIQVTQFVGFLAAYSLGSPEGSSLTMGVLGAVLVTWVTFTPSFLWIFAGAPYIEMIAANRKLSGALSCITAAVVGVIFNLAVWFGMNTMFADIHEVSIGLATILIPRLSSLQLFPMLIAAIAFAGLQFANIRMAYVILFGICAGIAFKVM